MNIIFGFVGAILIIVGISFLIFKGAIAMLAGYKPGKYDDEKLRKFAGLHIALLGLVWIATSVLLTLMPIHANSITILAIVIFIAIFLKMVIQGEKRYRLKEK